MSDIFDAPKKNFESSTTQDSLFSFQQEKDEEIIVDLLRFIGENPYREGLRETPKRVLKAWTEMTSGYNVNIPELMKVFEDGAEQYDGMVLVKDIKIESFCEHHMIPFFGVAHIAYIPDGKIVGLSKLARVADAFARRLQVQERLTTQIANALWENLKPKGVAVVIEARHLCMCYRGVKDPNSTTTTSSLKGAFLDEPATRAEFFNLIK